LNAGILIFLQLTVLIASQLLNQFWEIQTNKVLNIVHKKVLPIAHNECRKIMFSMSLTWIGSEVKGQSKRYVVHTSTVL
jgi:hypothetical protein